jgi:hypothetical protein
MRQVQIGLNESYLRFKIADSNYFINHNYKEIAHLSQNLAPIHQVPNSSFHHSSFTELIFQDKALIGNDEFQLQVNSNHNEEFQLKIDEQVININKDLISTDSNSLSATLLFGPAMMLNLALNQVFCLHASSFEYKGCIFIILAKSGTGKSTIARYFQDKFASRIADDIVAIKFVNDSLNLAPNFPQLKLSSSKQLLQNISNSNIKLIFANVSNKKTRLVSMDRFCALKSIIKHSVATKLFSSKLLARHLNFSSQLANKIQAYELKYQHSESSLNQLCGLLDELV